MRIRLVLLGGFEARLASGAPLVLPTKKARALLAYLAVHPGQSHPRDKLATLLWGESGDEQARTSLRQCLATLRKTLGTAAPSSLRIDGKTVALDPAAVEVDVASFERLVADGLPAALEEAVALYQGELLEGFEGAAAPFEEWLLVERERLRERALEALAKLLRHQIDAGATEAAIQTALRLLGVDPLQEAVHRTLMRLYVQQGRRANALRQYQACVGVLQRELGVEPEPETRQAYQEVLQSRARQVLEPEPHKGPARARARSLEPPLVGRETELTRLRELLAESSNGSGRSVVLLGEAGVGKTRLLDEVAAAALQRGGRHLIGRCYETEQILPFGPWVAALRAGLAGHEKEVLERLGPVWWAELSRLLPELAERGREPAGPADDPLRLFDAVARAIEILAEDRPLLLVIEDLHWADEMSVRLFGFLARRLEACSALLVGSAREEELSMAPLLPRLLEELRAQREFVLQLLSPLSKAETHDLVRMLAQAGTQESALGRVAGQVWAASEGNPFVAVETMRALQEGQRLDESTIGLPDRVRAVVAGRLERLGGRARELLAVAAVIGREFEFALLQHAAGLPEREAAEGVEELVRRRVLHGVGARLDFAHDRIRDVAYGQLLPPRRRLLHAAVGAAIEALHADDLAPHHGALGMHYRQGQAWDKAVTYLRHAGARAVDCSAHREAVGYFEQALQAVAHLPEGRNRSEQAFAIRMYSEQSYWALGEVRRMASHLGEVEALARALDDPIGLARVEMLGLTCHVTMGWPRRAIECGERGLAIGEAAGNVPIQVALNVMLGAAQCALGDFARAIDYARRTAALAQGFPPHRRLGQLGLPAVFWRVWLAIPLGETGSFSEAFALGAEALRIADEAAQGYSMALARLVLGDLHGLSGDPALAIPVLERAAALCKEYDVLILSPMILCSLGDAQARCGRVAEALSLLESAVAQAESRGTLLWQSRRTTCLGEAYLRAGRLADAQAAGKRALALADGHSERASRAYALRFLGETALRRDVPDSAAAEQLLGQALALAQQLGMAPLAERCRRDLQR